MTKTWNHYSIASSNNSKTKHPEETLRAFFISPSSLAVLILVPLQLMKVQFNNYLVGW